MPPGDTEATIQQGPRGPTSPEERALFPIALEQAALSLESQRGSTRSAELQLATFEADRQLAQDQLQNIRDRIVYLENKSGTSAYGLNTISAGEAAKELESLRKQELLAANRVTTVAAHRPILERQAAEDAATSRLQQETLQRVRDVISGKDFGVSPREQELIAQGISGISQDVATSRGLNRTDVPVMQAIAPSISQALLAQANANRSLLTGVNQFQQGMGLSNRQLQMGLAGQNPAAGLSGVYAGLAPQNQGQSSSRGLGGADIMSMFGQGAMGVGLGAYGLGAAGLLGGGTAATGGGATGAALGTYGAGMAMGCWIAEAIYGTNAPETGVIRWWLNVHFTKQPVGRVVMALYRKYGRWMAGYVQRWAWLRQALRPIFDLALQRGLATG